MFYAFGSQIYKKINQFISFLIYFSSIIQFMHFDVHQTPLYPLSLTSDKYCVVSIIFREIYPQAAITLSAYEHITESEGAEAAIEEFRKNTKKISK